MYSTWKCQKTINFEEKSAYKNLQLHVFMKTNVNLCCIEFGTYASVDWSYTKCATETDTKVWQFKLFPDVLKSPCCDVLLSNVDDRVCRGSLNWSSVYRKTFDFIHFRLDLLWSFIGRIQIRTRLTWNVLHVLEKDFRMAKIKRQT